MSEKTYHGYTIEEINDKYYIRYDGEENLAKIRDINGKLSRYWQEVAHYYMESKNELDEAEKRLSRIEDQIELDREEIKAELVMESRGLSRGKRWSDKARETISLDRVMTDEVKEQLNDAQREVSRWKEEVTVWKEIRKNLRFVSKRINNTIMGMGIEAKVNRNFSSDPDLDDNSNDNSRNYNKSQNNNKEEEDPKDMDVMETGQESDVTEDYKNKVGIEDEEEEVPF